MERQNSEVRNKRGQTLKEFLQNYHQNDWQHPSYTADCIIYAKNEDKISVLFIKRGDFPCIGQWAFPGGFVNIEESSEQAAARELQEETGLTDLPLTQLYTVSTPFRDPRCWIVTTVYLCQADSMPKVRAGDDADSAEWMNVMIEQNGSTTKLILENSAGERLHVVLDVFYDAHGKMDINKTTILSNEGVAFDHAKLLVYALQYIASNQK